MYETIQYITILTIPYNKLMSLILRVCTEGFLALAVDSF